jgi:hypothetical protein
MPPDFGGGTTSKKQKRPKEPGSKKLENDDDVILDSLAGTKKTSSTPKTTQRSSSTLRPIKGVSRPEGSRATKVDSSRSRDSSVTTGKTGASRKRRSTHLSSTQTSGLSSIEGPTKAWRRKKKERVGSQRSTAKLVTDDAYNFQLSTEVTPICVLGQSSGEAFGGGHRSVKMIRCRRVEIILLS